MMTVFPDRTDGGAKDGTKDGGVAAATHRSKLGFVAATMSISFSDDGFILKSGFSSSRSNEHQW